MSYLYHRLYEVYPLMRNTEVDGKVVPGISSQQQALNQLAATACTLAIAIAGKKSNNLRACLQASGEIHQHTFH